MEGDGSCQTMAAGGVAWQVKGQGEEGPHEVVWWWGNQRVKLNGNAGQTRLLGSAGKRPLGTDEQHHQPC